MLLWYAYTSILSVCIRARTAVEERMSPPCYAPSRIQRSVPSTGSFDISPSCSATLPHTNSFLEITMALYYIRDNYSTISVTPPGPKAHQHPPSPTPNNFNGLWVEFPSADDEP